MIMNVKYSYSNIWYNPGTEFATSMQQTITWINDAPLHWHKCVTMGQWDIAIKLGGINNIVLLSTII